MAPAGPLTALATRPVSTRALTCGPPALAECLLGRRIRGQEPGTEPIFGGVGALPATTVPIVAFHNLAQVPSS